MTGTAASSSSKGLKSILIWCFERIHFLGFALLAFGTASITDVEFQRAQFQKTLVQLQTQKEIEHSISQYLTFVQAKLRGAILYRSTPELQGIQVSTQRALEALSKLDSSSPNTREFPLEKYQNFVLNIQTTSASLSLESEDKSELKSKIQKIESDVAEALSLLQGEILVRQKKILSARAALNDLENRFRKILALTIVVGLFSFTIMGIQSRRRALLDKMLNTSERLHRLIFTSLDEAVFLCTHDGTITLMNNQAQKIFGLQNQDLRAKPLSSLFGQLVDENEQPLNLEDSVVAKAFQTRKSIRATTIGHKIDGRDTQWLSFNSTPLLSEDHITRDSVLISITDITESVRAQQIIERQKAVLISKSKMAALGELAGGIAHEINNPLAVMTLQNEELQAMAQTPDEKIDRAPVAKIASSIDRTVSRIVKIVRSVRGFARNAEEDEFENIDISEIIGEVAVLVEYKRIDASAELIFDIKPKDFKLRCRPTAIIQILVNLISNSFDAMMEKQVEAAWVKVQGRIEGANFVLSVSNAGPKISESVKARLFQAFFTTKKLGQGTGLGLTLSRDLARGHGGELSLQDKSEYTCFEVRLPLAEASQAPKAS